jgi:type I restriction-modification system DNA methylase subunit
LERLEADAGRGDVEAPENGRLPADDESFERRVVVWGVHEGAECKINKSGLLVEAVNLIDEMKIAEQNQDVQGDLYEYMLGHMQFAGRGGQFRTPRHIIRMMVEMADPKPR